MKGVIAIICAMSMCLLLIVTAFAAETSGNSFAIHAEKAEREAVLAEMRQTASNATLQEFGVIVDEGTMMPVYYGSLLDYAKTGEFVYEPFALGGKQLYVSDAIDAQGSFEGVMIFNADDIHMFMPSNDASKSVDFVDSIARIATSDRNGKRTTAGNTPVVAMDAKFMFVEGLGFVYYLNDGDEAKFVPANFKGVNGDVFTTQNGGIVAIDNELLTYAQQLAEIVEEQNLYLSSLAPGENPATGTGMTAYIAESPQHGESDALFAGFVLFGTIALMMCVVMAAKRNRTVR